MPICDPMNCMWLAKLLCPWNSLGKNTGVGSHYLLQGIFLTQGSNWGLPHCRQILYYLSPPGKPLQVAISSTISCPQLTRPRMGTWTQGRCFSGELGHELACKKMSQAIRLPPLGICWETWKTQTLSVGDSLSKCHVVARKAGEARWTVSRQRKLVIGERKAEQIFRERRNLKKTWEMRKTRRAPGKSRL